MSRTFIIAEAGINANGDIEIAKQLIESAKMAGCDAIKFQKRTLDKVYSKEELDKPRESPFGKTNRDLKEALEFSKEEYDIIDAYCKEIGIEWFVSPWDLESVKFMEQYPDVKYNKIASALLTHTELLEAVAKQGKYTFISTGMSKLEEIDRAVKIFDKYKCPYELMHCNSAYPSPTEDLNLRCIRALAGIYECKVGYSCHSTGILPPVVAVVLGATSIEKHITLDRTMFGSDQSASVEPSGFAKMVEYIRCAEDSLGDGRKVVTKAEEACKAKLRRTKDY